MKSTKNVFFIILLSCSIIIILILYSPMGSPYIYDCSEEVICSPIRISIKNNYNTKRFSTSSYDEGSTSEIELNNLATTQIQAPECAANPQVAPNAQFSECANLESTSTATTSSPNIHFKSANYGRTHYSGNNSNTGYSNASFPAVKTGMHNHSITEKPKLQGFLAINSNTTEDLRTTKGPQKGGGTPPPGGGGTEVPIGDGNITLILLALLYAIFKYRRTKKGAKTN